MATARAAGSAGTTSRATTPAVEKRSDPAHLGCDDRQARRHRIDDDLWEPSAGDGMDNMSAAGARRGRPRDPPRCRATRSVPSRPSCLARRSRAGRSGPSPMTSSSTERPRLASRAIASNRCRGPSLRPPCPPMPSAWPRRGPRKAVLSDNVASTTLARMTLVNMSASTRTASPVCSRSRVVASYISPVAMAPTLPSPRRRWPRTTARTLPATQLKAVHTGGSAGGPPTRRSTPAP